MKVNGLEAYEMDMVYRYGLMEPSTKAIGIMEKLRAKASLHILMVTYMMVNGRMIRPMDMEFIHMWMVLCMKVNGKMMFNVVKGKKFGKMGLFLRESIWMERKMEWDIIIGMMEAAIPESGRIIKFRVLVNTIGLMEESTREIG